MAAPDSVSLLNFSGDWTLNYDLSDEFDPILALQGVSWFTRQALKYATLTLHITETLNEDTTEPTLIVIEQTLTGGIPGTTESRRLDWTERPHEDGIFGRVVGKSAWADLDEASDKWLSEGWLDGKGRGGKGFIRSYVVNEERGWTADQIWGFTEFEGKRYYTRRVVVNKGAERKAARLVYDFLKVPEAKGPEIKKEEGG
ncbi:MAG: hypothetical protein M1814_000175 [Vezdaea aestivalis]|nr:MAG: hypothetical protein M1814_000175 [Vezdaea aestivalis]